MSSSSDFYILGMNIGADQRDYTFLHHTIPTSRNDTVGSLADEYQKNIPESNELDRLAQKNKPLKKNFFIFLSKKEVHSLTHKIPLLQSWFLIRA